MSATTVEEAELPISDLDMLLATLDTFNVQYTIIQDESGSTVECVGGDRGMKGFAGMAITFNFTPGHDDPAYDEKFVFIGAVRA